MLCILGFPGSKEMFSLLYTEHVCRRNRGPWKGLLWDRAAGTLPPLLFFLLSLSHSISGSGVHVIGWFWFHMYYIPREVTIFGAFTPNWVDWLRIQIFLILILHCHEKKQPGCEWRRLRYWCVNLSVLWLSIMTNNNYRIIFARSLFMFCTFRVREECLVWLSGKSVLK